MNCLIMDYLKKTLGGDVAVEEEYGKFSHCRAQKFSNQEGNFFLKDIEPESLANGNGDRWQLAQTIASRIERYSDLLSNSGIPLPQFHKIEAVRLNGTVSVFEIATFCGDDLTKILRECQSEQAADIVREILAKVAAVAFQDGLGIDPHPANWALDQGGTLRYVDLWPVQYRAEDNVELVGFPQPEDPEVAAYSRRRYYTVEGLLRILRFNLVRISAHLEDVFFHCADDVIGDGIVGEVFSQLPERVIVDFIRTGEIKKVVDIIEGLGPWNIDDLREIAFRLVPNEPKRLSELFNLTQMDFRLSLSERGKRLDQFKQELIKIVRSRH